jgi:hypothetical protein
MRNRALSYCSLDWTAERFNLNYTSLYLLSQVPITWHKAANVLWILLSLKEAVNVMEFQAQEMYWSWDHAKELYITTKTSQRYLHMFLEGSGPFTMNSNNSIQLKMALMNWSSLWYCKHHIKLWCNDEVIVKKEESSLLVVTLYSLETVQHLRGPISASFLFSLLWIGSSMFLWHNGVWITCHYNIEDHILQKNCH